MKHQGDKMDLSRMDEDILEIIARHSMFSLGEIRRGYKTVKSFDDLIRATKEAPESGRDLHYVCELYRIINGGAD